MASISLIVGSVRGKSTAVAEAVQQALISQGHHVTFHTQAKIAEVITNETEGLLICTSTTGQGQLPDNIAPFYTELVNQWPRIDHLKFAVIARGDSSFENTYCAAGKTFHHQLSEMAAQPLSEPLLLDRIESEHHNADAIAWVQQLAW